MSKRNILYVNQPNARSRVLDKLTVPLPVRKLHAYDGMWSFIIVVKITDHFFLFWARWIQSVHFHPICVRSIPSMSRSIRVVSFFQRFYHNIVRIYLSPMRATNATHHILLHYVVRITSVRSKSRESPHYAIFFYLPLLTNVLGPNFSPLHSRLLPASDLPLIRESSFTASNVYILHIGFTIAGFFPLYSLSSKKVSTRINILPLSRRMEGKTATDVGRLYELQTLRRVTPIRTSLQDVSVILPKFQVCM